jgi:hypothetical protein
MALPDWLPETFEEAGKNCKCVAEHFRNKCDLFLVRIHSMRSRHPCHRRTFHQRSTIRRFSAMLRCCRRNATKASLSSGMTATCWEVSISAPRGHLT